eukprot:2714494-Rhodomonas_salina.2
MTLRILWFTFERLWTSPRQEGQLPTVLGAHYAQRGTFSCTCGCMWLCVSASKCVCERESESVSVPNLIGMMRTGRGASCHPQGAQHRVGCRSSVHRACRGCRCRVDAHRTLHAPLRLFELSHGARLKLPPASPPPPAARSPMLLAPLRAPPPTSAGPALSPAERNDFLRLTTHAVRMARLEGAIRCADLVKSKAGFVRGL